MFDNIQYQKVIKSSGWRKISLGSWRPTGDSCVHVTEKIRVEPLFDYVEAAKATGNSTANLNSFFSLLFGRLLTDHPEFNVVVRGGKIYQREAVDTFFHVVQPGQTGDLSGLTVRDAGRKSFLQISDEMVQKIESARAGEDDDFSRSKKIFSFLPGFMARFVLDFIGWISYGLNLNLASAGIPKDPFGSLMITNVGSLGIRQGNSVIAPYTRIPMVVALCAVEKSPVVAANGELEVGVAMNIGFTMDHRIVDGIHISRMLKSLRKYVKQPELLESQGSGNLSFSSESSLPRIVEGGQYA